MLLCYVVIMLHCEFQDHYLRYINLMSFDELLFLNLLDAKICDRLDTREMNSVEKVHVNFVRTFSSLHRLFFDVTNVHCSLITAKEKTILPFGSCNND